MSIQVRSLSKRYGRNWAVHDLSFEVHSGRVTGFLGPNGAGKSTTMRSIVGLDRPTSGEALIGGQRYAKLRAPLHEGARCWMRSPHIARAERSTILRELQSDARKTNREVAAAVGVSPTTALDRTRALRDRGVIRGAVLDVDLPSIGRPVQALIAVRVRPPSRRVIESFRDWVGTLPETVGVFVTTGGDDFIIHVAVPDNDALYAFVIDRLTERKEVADVRTSVVFEHIRSPRIDPVFPKPARPVG